MKTNSIFIGDIYVCVKRVEHSLFDSQDINAAIFMGSDSIGHIEEEVALFKKNAILIKTKNGGYVDLAKLDLELLLYISTMSKGESFYPSSYPQKLVMMNSPCGQGSFSIDESSLRPYNEVQNVVEKNISIKKLKTTTKKMISLI